MRLGDLVDGRYELVARAGSGGMGEVFAAEDRHAGTRVAVKLVSGTAAVLDRFAREVRVLAAIEHPSVVGYVGHGEHRGGGYLAMEWLEGEDLAARIARGPLSVEATLDVARAVASALVEIHARGVVHRDIKPSNVFLIDGRCDRVKVLDFGIARRPSLTRITGTGVALGTPAYMAPEQARGDEVDGGADLYSLGCLIHECLCGRTPFHADHALAILARMLVEPPPSLADEGVEAPAALEGLVARLLDKEPLRRPASSEEVLASLTELDGGTRSALLSHPKVSMSERRVLSLVVISSELSSSETLFPSELDGLEGSLAALAERYDGRLESLGGGGFVVVFAGGEPGVCVARGAAFALAARPRVGGDAIALATGRGVVGRRLVAAEIIDRALAMVAGGSLEICVDETSARLLDGRFVAEREGEVIVLRGERSPVQPRRTVLGRETRFVGRRREVAGLVAAFESCVEESLAAVTLVVGEAGTGKSRLLREFIETLRGHPDVAAIYAGGADVVGAGAAFHLVSQALQRRLGEVDQRSLYDYVHARLVEGMDAAEAARRAELLAGLVRREGPGMGQGAVVAGLREEPVLLGDAIAEAWRALLDAECRRGALVLVLEDVHWGDSPSVALIDGALRVLDERPLFVLASARPRVRERFPQLWAARGVHEIGLSGLSDRIAVRLVRQILGDEVDERVVAQVVERGGGNPLLLEEIVRSLSADRPTLGELPDTVLGLVQARFDTVSERARQVLRAGSVFGERLRLAGVRALLGDASDLAGPVDELIAREFIVPRSGDSYAFVHAVTREAAYALLTDEDRLAAHRLAGAWLEERGEDDALAVAEHFELGGVRDKAGAWYGRAAEEALEGNDFSGAIHLAELAAARLPGDAASAKVLAESYYWRGDLSESVAAARVALAATTAGSDPWYAALSLLITSCGQSGDNDVVRALLDDALEQARAPVSDIVVVCVARGISQLMNLPSAELAPYRRRIEAFKANPGPLARGWIERVRAETSPHRWVVPDSALVRARAAFEEAGALRYALLMTVQEALVRSFAGEAAEAIVVLERAIVDAESLGIPFLGLLARFELAIALFLDGRDDACRERIAEIRVLVDRNLRTAVTITLLEGMMAFDEGDYARAERSARFGVEAAIPSPLKVSAYGILGRVLVRLGRAEEALEAAERGLSLSSPEEPDGMAELATIAAIESALALGDSARAQALAQRAWTWISGLPFDEAGRERYLGRRVMRELDVFIRRLVPEAARASTPEGS